MTDEPFLATITTSRLITSMSRNARAKWLFVAAVAALDMVWMKAAGFHFGEGFLTGAAAHNAGAGATTRDPNQPRHREPAGPTHGRAR